jgi:hypothetical protein
LGELKIPKTELNVKKKKTEEKKPQDMGCFLKPSGGEPDRELL